MISTNISIENEFSFNVYFNLNKKYKNNKYEIVLKTKIKGEKVSIPIGAKIEKDFWIKRDATHPYEKAKVDSSSGAVKQKECKAINKKIEKLLNFCHDYADAVNIAPTENEIIEYNASTFKEFIQKKLKGEKLADNPDAFITDYINKKEDGKLLSIGTIRNHRICLERLKQFCKDKGYNLSWRLFNEDFEDEFRCWANAKKSSYSLNTVDSTLSTFKVWLKKAEEKGKLVSLSYHHWHTKHNVKSEKTSIVLSEEEIERIYQLDFNSDTIKAKVAPNLNLQRMDECRDLFIIACHTALRFSDWDENIRNAEIITEKCIKVYNNKTKKYVKCPMNDTVRKLVSKYGSFASLPKAPCKSTALNYIRLAAKLASIIDDVTYHTDAGETKQDKKYNLIGTHTARRSFVTNLKKKGIASEDIAVATGHTTLSILEGYDKQTDIERISRLIA